MSDYNDIAKRNPQGSVAVINSFGYEILDRSNLGQSLSELVAQQGEPALRKIMDIHPDKDVILELFGANVTNEDKKDCGCSSCSNKHKQHNNEHYMNATGSEDGNSTNSSNTMTLAHQTNVILVVATLFIATALILKNK
ncbi:MAG: hypothetical protein WCJ62_11465 [Flavobacterium sp.]